MGTQCGVLPSSLTNTGGRGSNHVILHHGFSTVITFDLLIFHCSTILVEPGCDAGITVYGDIRIQVGL